MGTGLEALGDAAGHFPLVSAAVRDLELVFFSLPAFSSEPVLECTRLTFPSKIQPTWHHGRF